MQSKTATQTKTYTSKDLARTIDHTILRSTATTKDIEGGAQAAIRNEFRAFVVDPSYAAHLVRKGLLRNTGVILASVLDFPHGRDTAQNRVEGMKNLLRLSITEIDIVSKYYLILGGELEEFKKDIIAVIEAANGNTLKIILETDYLTPEQIKTATSLICEVVKETKAKNMIVKTNTGFAKEVKTENIEAVRIMKSTLEEQGLYAKTLEEITGGKIGIKASRGIKTKEDAISFLSEGAHILGTSSGEEIMKDS